MEVYIAKVISFFVSFFVCVVFTLLPFKFCFKLHKEAFKPLKTYGSESTHDDNTNHNDNETLKKNSDLNIKQQKNIEDSRVLKLLMCVGGGVFLGTFLLHLMPEVRQNLHFNIDYPVAELLIFCGFLLMLATELVADVLKQTCLDPPHHEKTHLSSTNDSKNNRLSIRTMGLILALSFHHIFEGFVIGFQETTIQVMNLTIGVLIHEITLCFILGLQAVKSMNKLTFSTLLIIVIFSSVMPLGILIGELITEFQPIEDEPRKKHNDGNVLVGVLQALSSGTFLYVTFFEILFENMTKIDESSDHVTHRGVLRHDQKDDNNKDNGKSKEENNNSRNKNMNNDGKNNDHYHHHHLLLSHHHHHNGNLTYRFLTILSFTFGFVIMSLLAMLPY